MGLSNQCLQTRLTLHHAHQCSWSSKCSSSGSKPWCSGMLLHCCSKALFRVGRCIEAQDLYTAPARPALSARDSHNSDTQESGHVPSMCYPRHAIVLGFVPPCAQTVPTRRDEGSPETPGFQWKTGPGAVTKHRASAATPSERGFVGRRFERSQRQTDSELRTSKPPKQGGLSTCGF